MDKSLTRAQKFSSARRALPVCAALNSIHSDGEVHWPKTECAGYKIFLDEPTVKHQGEIVAQHPNHASPEASIGTLSGLCGGIGYCEQGEDQTKIGRPSRQ